MLEYPIEKLKKSLSHKLIRYALVGGVSTFIHIFIASFYIYFVNNSIFQSNIIGFLFAYIFSYTMQSKLVFNHVISITKATKYFTVQFSSLILAILASGIFISYNSYLRTLIIAGLLPLITFIVHNIWTFKE